MNNLLKFHIAQINSLEYIDAADVKDSSEHFGFDIEKERIELDKLKIYYVSSSESSLTDIFRNSNPKLDKEDIKKVIELYIAKYKYMYAILHNAHGGSVISYYVSDIEYSTSTVDCNDEQLMNQVITGDIELYVNLIMSHL